MAGLDELFPGGAVGPGMGTGGGPTSLTGGDFGSGFSPDMGTLGGAGALGLGAYALSRQGGALPYGANIQNAAAGLGDVAQVAGGGYNDLMARGNTLINPLITGNLPPEAEQLVKNMTTSQTAGTKGRYASLGLTGSTMEGDAVQNVQNQAMAQRFQIAQQMAQIGTQAVSQAIQELGLSEKAYGDQAAAYGTLMKAQLDQDKATGDAIAGFAKSMGTSIAML